MKSLKAELVLLPNPAQVGLRQMSSSPYYRRKMGGVIMSMQFGLAVLSYVLPLFPLAYLWHLSVFKTAYDRLEIFRDNPIIPIGLASMVLQGLFFAWVFPKLFNGPDWVVNGLKFAGIFGVLGWSFMVLPVAAKYRMTSVGKFMVLESAFVALQFLVTGLLLAWVYRV